MNAPKDQLLFLTVFVAVCVPVIVAVWLLMPVYHYGEFREAEAKEPEPLISMNLVLSPRELMEKADAAIQTGEAALVQLEAEENEGADKGDAGVTEKEEAAKP